MPEQLQPCPWHDKDHDDNEAKPVFEWTADYAWRGHSGFGWVECSYCGAHGPFSDSEDQAAAEWNAHMAEALAELERTKESFERISTRAQRDYNDLRAELVESQAEIKAPCATCDQLRGVVERLERARNASGALRQSHEILMTENRDLRIKLAEAVEAIATTLRAKIETLGPSGGSTSPRADSEPRPAIEPGDPTPSDTINIANDSTACAGYGLGGLHARKKIEATGSPSGSDKSSSTPGQDLGHEGQKL